VLICVLGLSLLTWGLWGEAHQDGCHRWHSCLSDTGNYVCGDLGYCSGCPNNQYCLGGNPRAAPPPSPTPVPPVSWALVPGGGSTLSSPAATVFQGNLALFVRGSGDRLYVNWLLPNYRWTGWGLTPGGGSTPSAPAATVFQGNLVLVVRGTDDRLYVNWLLPSYQWTGWSGVPGGGFTPSTPAATDFQGDLALVVRGEDNQLYVNFLPTGP
jgi:hypothetical protein